MTAIEPCTIDHPELEGLDWQTIEDKGLTLHPVAYTAPWSGGETPVVTSDEFDRFVSAWRAFEGDDYWGEVIMHGGTDGLTMTLGRAEVEDEAFPAGEGGLFQIDGWTFVRRSAWAA